MPKSKRSKVVALTQTTKKTKEHKLSLIEEVRDAINSHESLYLFSYENMRSTKFKDVRMHFREKTEGGSSRLFLGKNKLLQIALGRSIEEEHSENLRHVSDLISGFVGLLMTSRPREDVESYFDSLNEKDYARAGCIAERTVVVTNDMLQSFPTSMVNQFRKLGLRVEVKVGKIILEGGREESVLCREGKVLGVEACKLLTLFHIKLAHFRLKLMCRWSGGEFEPY